MGKRKKTIEIPTTTELLNQEDILNQDSYDKIDPRKLKRLVPNTALNSFKLTEKQKELIDIIEKNKIIVISGPAGTGKTLVSCYYLIKSLMEHNFDKMVLSKPLEESGEKLGFLPGDIASKIDPYLESYKVNLLKFIKKENLESLVEKEVIEFKPLAYLRGTTFQSSLMILDEAQNADLRQIILFVTRMGTNSKVIISGDVRQHDISKNMVGMEYFYNMIKDIVGVGYFEFNDDDIMRDPILKEITKRYEVAKAEGTIPSNKK